MKKKILVVDSDAALRVQLAEAAQEKADVYIALSYEQALTEIRGFEFDALIMDLTTPHLRGLELLGVVNSLFPSVPVIVTGAASEVRWSQNAFSHGASYVFIKPVAPKTLAEATLNAVETRSDTLTAELVMLELEKAGV
jgi:DNA-binding NtrC family response regulator